MENAFSGKERNDFNVVVRLKEYKARSLPHMLAHRIAGSINAVVRQIRSYAEMEDNPYQLKALEESIKELSDDYTREHFLKKEAYQDLYYLWREWETGRGKRNFNPDWKMYEVVASFDRDMSPEELQREIDLLLTKLSQKLNVDIRYKKLNLKEVERRNELLNLLNEYKRGNLSAGEFVFKASSLLTGILPEKNALIFLHKKPEGGHHLHILIVPRNPEEKRIRFSPERFMEARLEYLPRHILERLLGKNLGAYDLRAIHLLREAFGKEEADKIVRQAREVGIPSDIFNRLVYSGNYETLLYEIKRRKSPRLDLGR